VTASPRVSVGPALYVWACERNRRSPEDYLERFPHLLEWISGEAQPTLKQLEAFANATHTPIGFFFFTEPPEEPVPIHDFRTIAGKPLGRPSPDLLDTIYVCQQRQDWYHEFARASGEHPLPFVGSAKLGDEVVHVAAEIRGTLGFDVTARGAMGTWSEALRELISNADDAGIMAMCSGIVGSNTRRKLDPEEFRGFALVDPLAPLVFVNGADTKSAQMFTLAHELAHIWLGATGVSDADLTRTPGSDVERWCDAVAAEVLVPLEMFRARYQRRADLPSELLRLARIFKVSTLVILRRMHDAGGLGRDRFWREYDAERQRLLALPKGKGGNFYLSTAARVSKRFARALIVSTSEGRSTFTEALRLLGMKNMQSFDGLAESLGMAV
jgi:Zn-dependent peptidase ImmA (M78 family)/transcriptional regulator with XRE-family HTH domain